MKKLHSPFPREIYERNARIYKILANPKRLEILNIIKHHELTVDELSKLVQIRKSNTSQHLALLRAYQVVKVRRKGQKAYYTGL
ncbi:MAG TPA: metalloregulator ArsR/SmtB family transcription factor [Patescibacteria group bacterium]|nr:metalloregulator ArsR/SmtB family transcription factor [Patescibacteria group bacterium]